MHVGLSATVGNIYHGKKRSKPMRVSIIKTTKESRANVNIRINRIDLHQLMPAKTTYPTG